jgi:ABC-type polar amino acid transport system ATPase subunit
MIGTEYGEIIIIKVRGLHKYYGPIAMIVVTNEPYLARNAADRVLLLDDGVWLEMAPPDELFAKPQKERTRQFLTRISLKDISGGT